MSVVELTGRIVPSIRVPRSAPERPELCRSWGRARVPSSSGSSVLPVWGRSSSVLCAAPSVGYRWYHSLWCK